MGFSQTKRFKQMYFEAQEGKRTKTRVSELEAELDAVRNADPDLDESKLAEIAQAKGYQLTKAEKKEVEKAVATGELEELLKDVQNPQEKQFWLDYASRIEARITKNFEKKYGERDKALGDLYMENRIQKSEDAAKKFVDGINKTNGTKLDYAKDIEPEIAKIIQANKSITLENVNLLALAKEVLATKGVELGKKLSSEETKKLNEEKKRANTETDTQTSLQPGSDEGKSLKDIMKEEMSRS
jgi:hypothetical protein